jgi:hypothetical protein
MDQGVAALSRILRFSHPSPFLRLLAHTSSTSPSIIHDKRQFSYSECLEAKRNRMCEALI